MQREISIEHKCLKLLLLNFTLLSNKFYKEKKRTNEKIIMGKGGVALGIIGLLLGAGGLPFIDSKFSRINNGKIYV